MACPLVPGELSGHHCIVSADTLGATWQFSGPDGDAEVAIFGRLPMNNAMLVVMQPVPGPKSCCARDTSSRKISPKVA